MVEAEHGADSSAFLVTPSEELAEEVRAPAARPAGRAGRRATRSAPPTWSRCSGASAASCWPPPWGRPLEFVNAYAPEHLQVACAEPVRRAGPGAQRRGNPAGPAGHLLAGQLRGGLQQRAAHRGLGPLGQRPVGLRDFLKVFLGGPPDRGGPGRTGRPGGRLAGYEGFAAHAWPSAPGRRRSRRPPGPRRPGRPMGADRGPAGRAFRLDRVLHEPGALRGRVLRPRLPAGAHAPAGRPPGRPQDAFRGLTWPAPRARAPRPRCWPGPCRPPGCAPGCTPRRTWRATWSATRVLENGASPTRGPQLLEDLGAQLRRHIETLPQEFLAGIRPAHHLRAAHPPGLRAVPRERLPGGRAGDRHRRKAGRHERGDPRAVPAHPHRAGAHRRAGRHPGRRSPARRAGSSSRASPCTARPRRPRCAPCCAASPRERGSPIAFLDEELEELSSRFTAGRHRVWSCASAVSRRGATAWRSSATFRPRTPPWWTWPPGGPWAWAGRPSSRAFAPPACPPAWSCCAPQPARGPGRGAHPAFRGAGPGGVPSPFRSGWGAAVRRGPRKEDRRDGRAAGPGLPAHRDHHPGHLQGERPGGDPPPVPGALSRRPSGAGHRCGPGAGPGAHGSPAAAAGPGLLLPGRGGAPAVAGPSWTISRPVGYHRTSMLRIAHLAAALALLAAHGTFLGRGLYLRRVGRGPCRAGPRGALPVAAPAAPDRPARPGRACAAANPGPLLHLLLGLSPLAAILLVFAGAWCCAGAPRRPGCCRRSTWR